MPDNDTTIAADLFDTLRSEQDMNSHICSLVLVGGSAPSFQGLLGVSIPAEVGGVGGSFLEEQIVIEEGAYR